LSSLGRQRGLNILYLGELQLNLSILEYGNKLLTRWVEDGGGMRSLLSLHLLSEIMSRVQRLEKLDRLPDPYEYFDVIVGAGAGA
jgi:hypothetical protein